MAGKKGMTRYTYELKERALPMHLEQGMTYAAIPQVLNDHAPSGSSCGCGSIGAKGGLASPNTPGVLAPPTACRPTSNACAWTLCMPS